MPWIAIGLVVGLIAVGVAIAAVLIARHRNPELAQSDDMSADQWIALGVIFTATGAALMASMGPYMAAMVALGVIYMGIGGRMKRQKSDDEADGKGTT